MLEGWSAAARRAVADVVLGARTLEVGTVVRVADGIATVVGLPGAGLEERLVVGNGKASGYVTALGRNGIACVLLDGAQAVHVGDAVSSTGDTVTVPVGPCLLGRVVDPLGRPLDDGGEPKADSRVAIERDAPPIIDRDLVTEPVQTGILAIDALFPLGRGQRELIVGDRGSGKSTLAVDIIVAQKTSDMICIHVSVGQPAAATAGVIDEVRRHGAPERCVFVVAGAASAPGLQWIAPYAGFAMGEYFRDRGGHVLVVIDSLTQHAATHRELGLLSGQPAGREAYPGDVFHIHARLLERAARLSQRCGGGSLTALPIAETEAGNLAAYIPTNLISITDGQIVLDSRLFNAGHKPAIDTGLSVSRVGGKTQDASLRALSARLRIDYAQFLELEMFSRFGAVGSGQANPGLTRGERVRALLCQPPLDPLPLEAEVAVLLALQEGLLDTLPSTAIADFRARIRSWIADEARGVAEAVAHGAVLSEPLRTRVVAELARLARRPP